MADEKLGLKYGNWTSLPDTIAKGTIYVAKAADGKAYMYVDTPTGEKLNITTPNSTFYAICSTATATKAKVVSCPGFELITGAQITVRFPKGIGLEAGDVTLNVNNTGAVPIIYRTAANSLSVNTSTIGYRTLTFVYNGTQFDIIGDLDTDTTGMNTTCASSGVYPLLAAKTYPTTDGTTSAATGIISLDKQILTDTQYGHLYVPGHLFAGRVDKKHYLDIIGPTMQFNHVDTDEGYYWEMGQPSHWYTLELTDPYDYSVLYFDCGGEEAYSNYYWFFNNGIDAEYLCHAGRRVPQIYSGTTAPSNSIGENGDIYIMYS